MSVSRRFVSGLLAAAALVPLVLFGSRTMAPVVEANGHPVDLWLAANPRIARAIIWEFPPPIEIPPVKRPILWTPIAFPFSPVTLAPRNLAPLTATTGITFLVRNQVDYAALTEGFEFRTLLASSPQNGWFGSNARTPGEVREYQPIGVPKSEYGAEIRGWAFWPEAAKEQLRQRYDAYAGWTSRACGLYAEYAASEFRSKPEGFDAAFSTLVDLDPAPLPDPLANLQPHHPSQSQVPFAMVDSKSAFALYVRHVAAQLALEINGCLPWSVTEYSAADLAPLFDGRVAFRYGVKGESHWGTLTATGHVVMTTVTPAPPLVVLGFLAQNAIIGTSQLDTVIRLLEWERYNLSHTMGGTTATPLANGELYWQYNGRAPMSRMINGTTMLEPVYFQGGHSYFEPAVLHWVGGCGGAGGFNGEALKMVNIPAHRTFYGHVQNRFAIGGGQHVGIGHGDDPYALRTAPEIPTAAILLDDVTFHEWFVNESDPAAVQRNVSRRVADLQLEYLPAELLKFRCWDIYLNRDHASSFVYNSGGFAGIYTVAEMEAKGLWTAIDAKLTAVGGCGAL